jgi:hypothetical protein
MVRNHRTIKQIRKAIENLPNNLNGIHTQLVLDILRDHPGLEDDKILQKMFMWLCQANYCLVFPEFAALVTVGRTLDNRIDGESIPWDTKGFVQQLGEFHQIDPHSNEINIPHLSMEEYLQSGALGGDLAWLHVDKMESQQYLASTCAWFLGCVDFSEPLTRKKPDKDAKTQEPNPPNPFRRLPGALGRELDPSTDERIGQMQERLKSFPGLEYVAINLPYHLRKAAYLDFKCEGTWTKTILRPQLDWLLEENLTESDGCYRSWQEIHAYFCYELPENCNCDTFPRPKDFLEKLRLRFLLRDSPSGCLWCGRLLLIPADSNESAETIVGSYKHDNEILCEACQCEIVGISDSNENKSSNCGRTYRLFQDPKLKYIVETEGEKFLLPISKCSCSACIGAQDGGHEK